MKTIVNGEKQELPAGLSVASLLDKLGAKGERVAVLVNDEIVSGGERDRRRLAEGDRIEVVTFAAGG